MNISKSRALVAVVLAVFLVHNANAGGGMSGGATEVTQVLNNVQLLAQVSKQAQTVSQLVAIYGKNVLMLEEQIKAGLKIGGVSFGDVMKMKADVEAYQNSLKTFGRDLGSLQQVFDVRLTEASLSNMSLQDYVQREAQRIAQGNLSAKARVQREMDIANQVSQDIMVVRQLGDKIQGTEGVHSATQLLNSQMNVMLQQVTKLVSLTSEAQGSDKAMEEARRAEEMAERARVRAQILQMEAEQKVRERAAIDSLRARQ